MDDPRAEARYAACWNTSKSNWPRWHWTLPQAERDFAWLAVLVEQSAEARLPEVSLADLRQAWMAILARAKHTRHHQVEQDSLSVREQMTRILRQLQGRGHVPVC